MFTIETASDKNWNSMVKNLMKETVPIILGNGLKMEIKFIGESIMMNYIKVDIIVIMLVMTLTIFNGLVL